jgi:hypothetical protein
MAERPVTFQILKYTSPEHFTPHAAQHRSLVEIIGDADIKKCGSGWHRTAAFLLSVSVTDYNTNTIYYNRHANKRH